MKAGMSSPTGPVLVTGGAGFIGSMVCRRLVKQGWHVVNIDKLTYAGSLASLHEIEGAPNYTFHQLDICDEAAMLDVMRSHEIAGVMHLAAESHVDRSIDMPEAFLQTNVIGTAHLLGAALHYWRGLGVQAQARFRFHHVSTDEVFGDLSFDGGVFTEKTAYDPSSPYSASKAASDHLVRAWARTYGLPVVLSNCSNNYGPYHFPEKLIPLIILNALEGKKLPVYGAGINIRDWLYVEDHAAALQAVFMYGRTSETYVIGGRAERSNLHVVKEVCAILDRKRPRSSGSYAELIGFVQDRPGHDRRYAVDPSKIERELGWRAKESFESGLEKTVDWYLANDWWWQPLRDDR